MCPELPAELWLQVFAHLPHRTLSNVASVSHLLHAVSATFRFAKFQFHPGTSAEDASTGTRLEHELARLAFWSSVPIAPLVRTCIIALYRVPTNPPGPLVTVLFAAVATFTNLRFLTFNCPATPLELPTLRIEALQHLQKLQIAQPPEALRRFLNLTDFVQDAQVMRACLSLHTLRLSFAHTDFARLHATVAPFPALRTLHIEIVGMFRAGMFPRTPMAPLLQEYRGPAKLLPLVLAGAQPLRLALTSGRTADVRDALQGRPRSAAQLTSLEMPLALHADHAVLQELLVLCPRLTHLALYSSDEDMTLPETKTLAASLADALRIPPSLGTVAFRWRLGGADVPDRAELEARLLAMVPGLQKVLFYTLARHLVGMMGFDAFDVWV